MVAEEVSDVARYWIVVNSPEIFATTRDEMKFRRHGFKSTRGRMVQRMEPGDGLVFYITGKKQFAAVAKVTSRVVEEQTRIWESKKKPQEMYPHRVDIEPVVVLDEDRWLDAEPYHDRFRWTQKWPREHWTLAYQGNLHEIPEEDFQLVLEDMRVAAAVPVR